MSTLTSHWCLLSLCETAILSNQQKIKIKTLFIDSIQLLVPHNLTSNKFNVLETGKLVSGNKLTI